MRGSRRQWGGIRVRAPKGGVAGARAPRGEEAVSWGSGFFSGLGWWWLAANWVPGLRGRRRFIRTLRFLEVV